MDEIISQYGKAIITFVVVVALIGVFVFLLKAEGGTVSNAFSDMISNFFQQASSAITPPTP